MFLFRLQHFSLTSITQEPVIAHTSRVIGNLEYQAVVTGPARTLPILGLGFVRSVACTDGSTITIFFRMSCKDAAATLHNSLMNYSIFAKLGYFIQIVKTSRVAVRTGIDTSQSSSTPLASLAPFECFVSSLQGRTQ